MTEQPKEKSDHRDVNKIVRILNGKTLKYTVHLLMKDGTEKQVQTATPPQIEWDPNLRCPMLVHRVTSDYTSVPLARFDDIDVIQVEENVE